MHYVSGLFCVGCVYRHTLKLSQRSSWGCVDKKWNQGTAKPIHLENEVARRHLKQSGVKK